MRVRDKLYFLAIIVVFFLSACGAEVVTDKPEPEHSLWTRACVVVEVDDARVVVEDSVCHRWSFFSDAGDWELGDGCSLLLDNNGTEEIYDDTIVRSDFFRVDILNDTASRFW